MAETVNIGELAVEVSNEVFKFFRWDIIELTDENFPCIKPQEHKKQKEPKDISENKKLSHTHPVDVVFKYKNPYSGVDILINTDLKSYKKETIVTSSVRDALQSLAKTIDCASVSQIWQERYAIATDNYEIRGMLFVYNHDGEYDKDFFDIFRTKRKADGSVIANGISLSSIGIKKNQKIHIVDPALINYMTTIKADISELHMDGKFPRKEFSFYYPDLIRHKTVNDNKRSRPATIEALTAPYLIIEHDEFEVENDNGNVIKNSSGYLIYYNKDGSNPYEFVYLFDTLSRYQILNGEHSLRIRFAHHTPDPDIISKFKKAIDIYVKNWGLDSNRKGMLERIEIKEVSILKRCFKTKELGWRN